MQLSMEALKSKIEALYLEHKAYRCASRPYRARIGPHLLGEGSRANKQTSIGLYGRAA
jgi:hypothetical protein